MTILDARGRSPDAPKSEKDWSAIEAINRGVAVRLGSNLANSLVCRFRPLLQHPRPLPDGRPYPRPVLDSLCEHVPRFAEITPPTFELASVPIRRDETI